MKVLPVSVLICSYNRKEQLVLCLDSILFNSKYLPDEVIVADSSSNGFLDKLFLIDRYQNLYHKIKYCKFKNNSIPFLRNKLVDMAKNDICLFVDDDVILDKMAICKTNQSFKKILNLAIIGGVGYPVSKVNIFSNYMFQIHYGEFVNKKKITIEVPFCPTMICGFKKSIFKKYNLKFDENMANLEDVDICLKLKKRGEKILLSKEIFGFHNYRKTLKEYYGSFRNYYSFVTLLYKKHKVDYFGVGEILENDSWINFVKYILRNDYNDILLSNDWLGKLESNCLCFIRKVAMWRALWTKR